MKKLIPLLIAIPLALVACKDKADKNPVRNITQATKDRDLQGTWQTGCQATPIDAIISGFMSDFQASVKSARVQYKYEGSNVNRVTLVYNAADCTGAESYIFNESGRFEINDKDKSNDGGKFIDMKYEKVSLTIKDDNGAKVANERKLCGQQGWAVGKEVNVTGNAKDLNCYGVQVPRSNANIYRIDKPAGDQKWVLFLGANPAKDAQPNQRPATLNMGLKFEKK